MALFFWVVLAGVGQVGLSAKQSWCAAYAPIGIGLPVVAWLGGAGGAVMRWPVIHLGCWLRRRIPR